MDFERRLSWSRRGVRKELHVWLYRSGSMLGSLRWYLFGTCRYRSSPISVRFRDWPRMQNRCYCPDGRTTELVVTFFNLVFSFHLSRSWVKPPCTCDKIMWLLCPEDHGDEIEEYGLARLEAEFPGVQPIQEPTHAHA